jgi:prepilin-type N-terminal cleavage/methylation domain-containing protein
MRNGFSFIEVIIVVAIASSIVLVVGNLSSNTDVLNNLVSRELQSKSDISQTLQIMTSEIRSAGPSASGAFALESAATSSFVFYSDIDKSGSVKRVRYFFTSSTIYKGTTAPTGIPAIYPTSTEVVVNVVDNVNLSASSSLFTYYDSAYTGTQGAMSSTAIQNIRLVNIAFGATIQPQQAPGPQYFSAMVAIRNLRSN